MKVQAAQITQDGLEQQLTLPVSALERLHEAVGGRPGRVAARLRLRNHEGVIRISGEVRAQLEVPCQRCEEAVPAETVLEVVANLLPRSAYDRQGEETHLGEHDLDVDFYDGDEIDLAALAEDEVLIALPEMGAVEEDEDERCLRCGITVEELYRDEEADEAHPFAALRHMLRND